jgi:DinB superfamily
MDSVVKNILWHQFGAAIDMFDDAICACPEQLWTANLWDDPDDPQYGQFWYVAYHTLFWLDLYLTGVYEGFAPPAPFSDDKLPDKPYTKGEIRNYLLQCRHKCQSVIEGLTDEKANQICKFPFMELGFLELQMYTMRHVQEHAAQMNLLLGQNGIAEPDWVAQARENAL